MINYQLMVSFPDQSKEYTYGFEAGTLWCRMSSNHETAIEVTTRVENRECIDNMAAALGWRVDRENTCVEGYDFTSLTKEFNPDRKPARKLAVVGGTDGSSKVG